ncbi:MAG: DUF2442 domain-containing protein [Chloroflexota bacterium]|nr:DUF2442 domain-containing protein [Chloroflexota bacterium]MDE2958952.1 DUF2442 domain-containing protein [Chloroflexota bacterium]
MSSSPRVDGQTIRAVEVNASGALLTVTLDNGMIVSVPLDWYPRLYESTAEERAHWSLIGGGIGIRWDEIDEDISIAGLLDGRRSGESEKSLARWRTSRQRAEAAP